MIATKHGTFYRIPRAQPLSVLITLLVIAVLITGGYEAIIGYVDPERSLVGAVREALDPNQAEQDTASTYWLTVIVPTQTYGLDDSEAWTAWRGEHYQVALEEDGWLLVRREEDPIDKLVWIKREPWMHIEGE
jgi:hypothetical protein